MDLLFKKYASPFLLLDEIIANSDFVEWIQKFADAENESQIYDIWIHKVDGKSFDDFRQSVLSTQSNEADKEQIETTIQSSKSILNNFVPQK